MPQLAIRQSSQITEAAIQEINRLHAGIIASARNSISDAIRIGEILSQIKSVLKNTNWINWLQENLPFSDRTARRYVSCFERKDQLALDNVSNLGEAYALLASNNGSGQHSQRLHEPSFWAESVKSTNALTGKFNHEIRDRPIETWGREKWISVAAALEPLAQLHAKLKSLIQ